MPGNNRLFVGNSGLAQEPFPLGGSKRAGDRDLTVLPHESVPEREASEEGKAEISESVAMEVADEPTEGSVLLQPSQECDDLLVRQVVGKLRRDNEIELSRRPVGKGVIVDEL